MKCLDPKLCYTDRKGVRRLKHFSLANPAFKKLAQQVFDCGTCIFCRKGNSYELAIRCVLHASMHKENCFLTLTYDENREGYHNELDYREIQLFKKRLRQHVLRKHQRLIKIFNVHEYGKNGKKHWHLVLFNHDFKDKTFRTVSKGKTLYTSKTLEKLWPFGFNTVGDVTEASAMYQAQYTQKDILNGNTNNKKKSKSNHSGIGRDYFLMHYFQILSHGFIPFGGKRAPLPRYFERLAHKHYAHFFEPSAFVDLPHRKKLHTRFNLRTGPPNIQIAELFIRYNETRKEKILELEKEWEKTIEEHLTNETKPDFMKAAENYLYDLRNKQQEQKF